MTTPTEAQAAESQFLAAQGVAGNAFQFLKARVEEQSREIQALSGNLEDCRRNRNRYATLRKDAEYELASHRAAGSASIEVKRLEAKVAELEGMNAALERQVKDVMAAKDLWGERCFEEQARVATAAKDERERIAGLIENDRSMIVTRYAPKGSGWDSAIAWLRDGAPDSSSLDVPKREGRRLVCCGCGQDRPESQGTEHGEAGYRYKERSHASGKEVRAMLTCQCCQANYAEIVWPEGGAR